VQFVPDFVFGSTEQKRGRDGAALYLLRVDIETGEGVRALYVGGSGRHGSESVRDAVGAALRGAGATEIEPGGRLRVEYLGTAPNSTGTGIRKRYAAKYAPPTKP
jgi:hypothetical protein